MDKILAKAQELAAQKEMIDAERQVAKLDKEYNDIKLQLRTVLGDDAIEIIEGGKPYFTESRNTVYLQNGDWLFNEGGWYEKPNCSLRNLKVEQHSYSSDWCHFSDLATFGAAIAKELQKIDQQEKSKKYNEERAEAYYNANPDGWATGYFKRLVIDIDAYDGGRRGHLKSGQRLLLALTGYLADKEEIPDWEDGDPDPDDSKEQS